MPFFVLFFRNLFNVQLKHDYISHFLDYSYKNFLVLISITRDKMNYRYAAVLYWTECVIQKAYSQR